ncbi:MAG: hypothetical protein NC092_02685 [Butyrivibrio sp.]|nr:hypothetical protein [Muribaculum sp.]MCM1551580.1 hypothetical protein [Butyrivibrio sp.]
MDKRSLYGQLRTGLLLTLAVAADICAWCSLLTVNPHFVWLSLGAIAAVLAAYLVCLGQKPRTRIGGAVLYLAVCAGLGLVKSGTVMRGGVLALQPMVERINLRQNIHLTLPDAAGAGTGALTFALLLFLAVQILPLVYAVLRRKVWVAGLVYLMPVLVSSASQSFPDISAVAGMIFAMGMIAVSARFQGDRNTENRAFLVMQLLTGAAAAVAYWVILPPMDELYEDITDARMYLTFVVNERILPEVQTVWSWGGMFKSGTIEGELVQEKGFSYTQSEFFEVTVDEYPRVTVYLRGFVGDTYTGSAWEAEEEDRLARYYAEHGFTPPEDYASLVNNSYEILERCQAEGAEPYTMTIEELQGDNVYSLYPYGARLEENGAVHADGSLDKQGESCSYEYYPIWTYDSVNRNMETELLSGLNQESLMYRQYVYDNYRDYPQELLPRLSAWLETVGTETSDVRYSVYNIVNLLDQTANYDLNVPACPPEQDFVENFLFERRAGYCAHFASAAVLMLRRQGIPARYATGYCAHPSEFVENGDGTYTAVIRDRQAHAWAEIYLGVLGWVPIEFTPTDVAFPQDNRWEMLQQFEVVAGEDFLDFSEFWEDGEELSEDDEEDEEDEEEDEEDDEDEEEDDDEEALEEVIDSEESEGWRNQRALLWGAAGGLALLLVLSWGVAACHRHRRRVLYQKMEAAERVCDQYRRLVRIMLHAGADSQIMKEWDCLVAELKRLNIAYTKGELDRLLSEVDACTYGSSQPDAASLQEVERICKGLRGQLYGHIPLWKRRIVVRWQEWEGKYYADNRVEQGKL